MKTLRGAGADGLARVRRRGREEVGAGEEVDAGGASAGPVAGRALRSDEGGDVARQAGDAAIIGRERAAAAARAPAADATGETTTGRSASAAARAAARRGFQNAATGRLITHKPGAAVQATRAIAALQLAGSAPDADHHSRQHRRRPEDHTNLAR